MSRLLVFFAASALAACGASAANSSSTAGSTGSGAGGPSSSSSGAGGGVSSVSSDTATAATGTTGVGGGSGGGAPLPGCYRTCKEAADCAVAGTAIYDANHFDCTNDICVWRGCSGDADCTAAFGSPNYVCAVGVGSPTPNCFPTCQTPHDCVVPNSPLYDDDNFKCDGMRCEWIGCKSDQECQVVMQNQGYVCDAAASPLPACVLTCMSSADCVTNNSDLYGADNYACVNQRCQWLGCNADAECIDAFMNPNYVCR